MAAREVHYRGHVQGVGFRYTVRQIAEGFDVTGAVENLADGRVRLRVQGAAAEVEGLLEEVRRSHLHGFIRGEEIREVEADPGLRGFHIAG
ncbi:MAG: acylphosphatase [Bdellovibrionaceae bacterium]|nr:acylphosphatase [Pseudobdellovibrionaceae bacterium]